MNKFIIIGVLCCCLTLSHSAPFAAELSVDDPTIVEGDIKLLPGTKSLGINDAKRLWPNGIVPYTIESDNFSESNLTEIKASMQMIADKTSYIQDRCITFVPKTDKHENWIRIFNGNGCYSYVGKVGKFGSNGIGPQDVSLGVPGCIYKGTIVHELCHALGWKHEQNRSDRDKYVTINLDNVKQTMQHNFDKYPEGDYFSTPYDYKSIMHYAEKAFAINRTINTITPKEAGIDLIPSYDKTDAQVLTAYDILAIRTRYSCSGGAITVAPTSTTTTKPLPSSSCKNAIYYCNAYNNTRISDYCDKGKNYQLGGMKFVDACNRLCGVCTAPFDPCEDKWYCRDYEENKNAWCSNPGNTVNGIPFVEACKTMCNTCGAKSIQVSLLKAGPIRRL